MIALRTSNKVYYEQFLHRLCPTNTQFLCVLQTGNQQARLPPHQTSQYRPQSTIQTTLLPTTASSSLRSISKIESTDLPLHQSFANTQYSPLLHPHHQDAYHDEVSDDSGKCYSNDKNTSVFCPVCNRSFRGSYGKYNLKKHFLIHQGEKPFKCPLCIYGTIQKAHLKRHLEAIHSTTYEEAFDAASSVDTGLEHVVDQIQSYNSSCDGSVVDPFGRNDTATSANRHFPSNMATDDFLETPTTTDVDSKL